MRKRFLDADINNKSWFRKLIDWIVSIFEKMTPTSWRESKLTENTNTELERLFQDIDSGKFRSSKTQENRFTDAVAETSGGVSNPIYAIVAKENIIIITKNNLNDFSFSNLKLSRCVFSCITRAILTHFIASIFCPSVFGSPIKAITESPIYLSIVAPWLMATLAISSR